MKFLREKYTKIIFTIMFFAYLAYLSYLTFFDHFYGRGLFNRSINIIPFKTIIQFLTSSYNQNTVVTNILGNIAAFMPMGFLLPIVFKKPVNFKKVLTAIIVATFTIEILQYIAGVGVADVDDLILNTLGGILGYAIYKVFMKIKIMLI